MTLSYESLPNHVNNASLLNHFFGLCKFFIFNLSQEFLSPLYCVSVIRSGRGRQRGLCMRVQPILGQTRSQISVCWMILNSNKLHQLYLSSFYSKVNAGFLGCTHKRELCVCVCEVVDIFLFKCKILKHTFSSICVFSLFCKLCLTNKFDLCLCLNVFNFNFFFLKKLTHMIFNDLISLLNILRIQTRENFCIQPVHLENIEFLYSLQTNTHSFRFCSCFLDFNYQNNNNTFRRRWLERHLNILYYYLPCLI